jgi:hypothetical protein
VQVVRVDLERRQVDLGLTEILEAVRLKERGRSGRRPATAEARGPRPKDRGRDKGRAAEREARKPGKTERRRKTRAGRRERLAKKRGR